MIAAEFEPALNDGRRRSPRAPVSLDGRIGRGKLDRTLCKITALSRHGVALQTYSAIPCGSMIWLTLPLVGTHAARVVYAGEFDAGCDFVAPLSAGDVELLIEMDATLSARTRLGHEDAFGPRTSPAYLAFPA